MDLRGAALIWLTGRLSTEKRWLAIQVPRRAPCKYKGIWKHLGPNETSVQLYNKTTSSDFYYELNRGSQSAKHLLLSFSKDARTQQDNGHFWHVLTAHCGEWWNKKEQLQRAVRWRAAADRLHTSNFSVRQVFPFTVPCCLWTWAVCSRKSDHSYSKDDGKKGQSYILLTVVWPKLSSNQPGSSLYFTKSKGGKIPTVSNCWYRCASTELFAVTRSDTALKNSLSVFLSIKNQLHKGFR